MDSAPFVRAADGTDIPLAPVNIQVDFTIKTALVDALGQAQIVPIDQAISMQTALANHWFRKAQRQETEIADLKARLDEASREGRVYELAPDIAVTAEDFAELKSLQKVCAEQLGCESVEEVAKLAAGYRMTGVSRQLPSDMEVACRALGFITPGGLRAFLESHGLRDQIRQLEAAEVLK